jgi:hypothetical protein
MRQTLLLITLSIFCLTGYCQEFSLRKMSNKDTATINYSVASGEHGSIHKGIILVKERSQIKATHIVYNFGISLLPNGIIEVDINSFIPMNEDSVKAFYRAFKNNFTILKKEWVLNDEQINCLEKFFKEAENFELQGFSNAPEYYSIITDYRELVILDQSGKWDKHKDLKKMLELKASQ